ncbi:response regulator receiver domain protein [Mobiluncus holmesii ATCC 35242]|uniref:Response regulator receiver domain protein n=2 Tax=Actinomycetaceae TaxID=2049 RepID=E6M1F6_9ACTO|nr:MULTISPECIES: response regulator transcription factor [Mobiluncus]EFU82701.1 response regulator receiver domain protein [Mobiluncus holmesii ATCC 35242]
MPPDSGIPHKWQGYDDMQNRYPGGVTMNQDAYLLNKRILLVDDEQDLLDMVLSILKESGFRQIMTARSVKEALEVAQKATPELAIIDVMLPDGTGFELMNKLKQYADCPILLLTACGEDEDRFKGFSLGADDYIVKPFHPKELTYRIMAILRRSYRGENPIVALRNSQIDFSSAEVIKDNERIRLTAKEHDILSALYRNAGRIVTIEALCEAAWGTNPFGYENSLMAHIRRIREKIERYPSQPVSLVTVRGLGYKLILEEK